MSAPIISIVIPTYKRNKELVRLLKSIWASNYSQEKLEIIIIDNAADPKLLKIIETSYENAKLIKTDKNLYSNGARRIGSESASGDYIFFIDDDNVIDKDCISVLVAELERSPEVGAVGPLMMNSDSDKIWCIGGRVSRLGIPYHPNQGSLLSNTHLPKVITNLDYLPNACMVRRNILKKAPLDDKNFPHNWAEIDFGLRIRELGLKIECMTEARDRHYIGYSGRLTRIGREVTYDQAKSRVLFRKRHLGNMNVWVAFWLIIFPASSIYYALRIVQSSDNRLQIFYAYLRGTHDGLVRPLEETTPFVEGGQS